jgi:hypothetical protein
MMIVLIVRIGGIVITIPYKNVASALVIVV